MNASKTFRKFGFKVMGGADEDYPTNAVVQVSAADSTISAHLMTPGEIDYFIDNAHADLDKVRQQAKAALARANRQKA